MLVRSVKDAFLLWCSSRSSVASGLQTGSGSVFALLNTAGYHWFLTMREFGVTGNCVVVIKCQQIFPFLMWSSTWCSMSIQIPRRWFHFCLLQLGSGVRSQRRHCCVLGPQGCVAGSREFRHWPLKSQGAHMEEGQFTRFCLFTSFCLLDLIFFFLSGILNMTCEE